MEDRAKKLRKLRVAEDRRYIECDMSTSLRNRMDELWEHAQVCLEGGGSRRRSFTVIGASGTGKSTSLMHAWRSMVDLRPHVNSSGKKVIPGVSLVVKKAWNTRDLALKLLEALGQKQVEEGNEAKLYETLANQLKASCTILLHLDEAQHLLKSGSDKAIKNMQDRFKSLLVIEDWPLHLILSGVGELASLLVSDDEQLPNRSTAMRFETLAFPQDAEQLKGLLKDIVVDHLDLQLDPSLGTDDFLGRLLHATGGGRGTIIEYTREASYKAFSKGHSHVTPRDFQWCYERFSGCKADENIFEATNWQMLDRKKALADFVPAPKPGKKVS